MSIALSETLAPLRARHARSVHEEEILRVAVNFEADADGKHLAKVRREVLAWAKRRCGGTLPAEAWSGDTFDYLAGGRTTLAVSLISDAASIWALRTDDPDKSVAGRTWTTEVTIGQDSSLAPRLSVRLLASSAERRLDIDPAVPGFLKQVAGKCKLTMDSIPILLDPPVVNTPDNAQQLVDFIRDPSRKHPVFVATGVQGAEDPNLPLIDAVLLSHSIVAIAHVVIVPGDLTDELTDTLGRRRSVFQGGVRAYLPGFTAGSDPFGHPLYTADVLRNDNGAERCVRSLRRLAARESLLRRRLNHDVLTFSTVRSASLRSERQKKAVEGASESVKLDAAQGEIQALEEELTKARDWEDQLSRLHAEAEERAISAEAQLRGAIAQLQFFKEKNLDKSQVQAETEEIPQSWEELADWVDQNLSGRLAISPTARRGIKKAEFNDVALAIRCLTWLAGECRDRKLDGGGSLSEHPIENGVRNSACGADVYEFDFQGQRLLADWHVKNGGNTRDPKRCLRIYYAWDIQSQQIVVSDMPSHRRTGAS